MRRFYQPEIRLLGKWFHKASVQLTRFVRQELGLLIELARRINAVLALVCNDG